MSRGRAALALLGLALVAGCGSSSDDDPATVEATDSPTAPASSAPARADGCTGATASTAAPQQYDEEPPLTVDPTTYQATLKTNCGTIVLALDAKAAPHTVNSFAFLAGEHFFDGTPCHRLTTAGIFVLQCGDPTGSGGGGPGYEIPDENLKGAKYPAGTVAMANAGPGTGGSQFFLVYKDTPPGALDPNYTPFGRIVEGLDVLRRIAAEGTDGPGDGAPNQPVVIESFTVAKPG
jgi:peptidyl-prolyl cis-trans isomerase B (cyclophilin B)